MKIPNCLRKYLTMKLLKILAVVAVLGFYASFLLVKIDLPGLDNDAGLYISDGKLIWEAKSVFKTNAYSYVETNYPIVYDHWLSSVAFYLVTSLTGFVGLSIFKIIIYLSAFGVLFWVATKKADFWLVAILSFPAIAILKERVRTRPEVFSFLFIALFLYFLIDLEKHPEHKRIYWLIPLQIFWVNFHIYFFLGIVLVTGFLLEKITLNFKNFWRVPIVKKLALLIPILVLVCFVNPNGLNGVLAPIHSHSYATFMVNENLPLFNPKASFFAWDIFGSAFMPAVFIFLYSLVFGFKQKQKPIFYFLAGFSSAAAVLVYARFIVLFALMFLPAASVNFNEIYLKAKDYFKRKWPKPAILFVYALAVIIIVAFSYQAYQSKVIAAEQGFQADQGIGLYPGANNAANFFKENNLKGPIFNDYDIGGYIIYNFFPKEKVFVDNSGADSYPASFFDDIYKPALEQKDKWQQTEQKYGINAIFMSLQNGGPVEGDFLIQRLHEPGWALVYADSYAAILIKNIPENQAVIKKFQITAENVQDKISSLLNSNDVADRLVGGSLLEMIGRDDLYDPFMAKTLNEYPKNSEVWMFMGSAKLFKNDVPDVVSAVYYLENAVKMGENSPQNYALLGLAYFELHQLQKAQSEFREALWLNPNLQDAADYLNMVEGYLNASK